MKLTHFVIFQSIIILGISALVYQHNDKAKVIKVPPQELSQWYKPENKRQTWLHNMFKLRREMQAVETYAKNEDEQHLNQWQKQLSEHYLKIGDMVPSWRNKLDVKALNVLQKSIVEKRYQDIVPSLNRLQKSCDACHDDYQAITALLYRVPDFSEMKVKISSTESIPFHSHMDGLTKQVNQIKIASSDNMPELALSSLTELTLGINQLGDTCKNCHKNNSQTYPSSAIKQTLNDLAVSLELGNKKDQGRYLGHLAVTGCATCHGTHKLAYGIKEVISAEVDIIKLLKH